jgi:hypothetical protein
VQKMAQASKIERMLRQTIGIKIYMRQNLLVLENISDISRFFYCTYTLNQNFIDGNKISIKIMLIEYIKYK